MKSKPIIIFEEVNSLDRLRISFYHWFGHKSYFLRVHKSCSHKNWFIGYQRSGKLIQVENPSDKLWSEQYFEGYNFHHSFENIHKLTSYIQQNPLMKKIGSIFNIPQIELIFKRHLNFRLARFFFLNSVLHQLESLFPNEEIVFVPSKGIQRLPSEGCEIWDTQRFKKYIPVNHISYFELKRSRFSKISILCCWFRLQKNWMRSKMMLVAAMIILIKNKIKKTQYALKNHYDFAIMISNPDRQLQDRLQGIDYFIDPTFVPRDKTLFLSYKPLNATHKQHMASRSVYYIDQPDAFITGSDLFRALGLVLALFFLRTRDPFIVMEQMKVIYTAVRWLGLTKIISLNKLISLGADIGVQAMTRNMILNQHRCKTVYCTDSASYSNVYQKSTPPPFKDGLYGFLNYDVLLTTTDHVATYFKDMGASFNTSIAIGSLSASLITRFKKNIEGSPLKEMMYQHGYQRNHKVVSVFDTTFNDHLVITGQDGCDFLEQFLMLLRRLPNIFVILKEKKAHHIHQKLTSAYPKLMQFYQYFEEHPRCLRLNHVYNALEIIALSDLTISFPFTSATYEALAARQKAIWFDVNNKFRGTFFDRVPGLVCHTYQELQERVETLLFHTKPSEYDHYLETHIKTEIEPFLDGKALDRFHHTLHHLTA